MRRWPALRLIRTRQRGLPHARNTGIANCRSPYIAFLDSDDVWEAAQRERQMRLFSPASSRVGLVYCSYYHIDESGRRIESCRIVEPQRRADLLHDLLLERNIISGSGSAVVARREHLERTGGFDEKLTFGEDWDLWLRMAAVAEFDFVPDALVGIRLHQESMQGGEVSQKNERFLCQTLLILDRWYKTPVFPAQLHGEYRRTVVHFAMLRAARPPAFGPGVLAGAFPGDQVPHRPLRARLILRSVGFPRNAVWNDTEAARPLRSGQGCDVDTAAGAIPGTNPVYSRARLPLTSFALGWPRARTTVQLFHQVLDQTCCGRVGGVCRVNGRWPGRLRPSGSSAPDRPWMRSALGHEAAKARRMRVAVSTTRAAIFKRRRRSVANSAAANSRALGMASRIVSFSQ